MLEYRQTDTLRNTPNSAAPTGEYLLAVALNVHKENGVNNSEKSITSLNIKIDAINRRERYNNRSRRQVTRAYLHIQSKSQHRSTAAYLYKYFIILHVIWRTRNIVQGTIATAMHRTHFSKENHKHHRPTAVRTRKCRQRQRAACSKCQYVPLWHCSSLWLRR